MRNDLITAAITWLLSKLANSGQDWILLGVLFLILAIALYPLIGGKKKVRFYLLNPEEHRLLTDLFVVESAGHEGRVAPKPTPRSYYEVHAANRGKILLVINDSGKIVGDVQIPADANCAVLTLELRRRTRPVIVQTTDATVREVLAGKI